MKLPARFNGETRHSHPACRTRRDECSLYSAEVRQSRPLAHHGTVPRVLYHAGMKTHSTAAIAGTVLAALLFASAASARDHIALNGVWALVPAKSNFGGQPVVQTGTVTIDDRQGNIAVTRNFKYEGTSEVVFYNDITDSQRNATVHAGPGLKSKTRWDHNVLRVTTTQSGAVTLEGYSLAADGTMLVDVLTPAGKPITLVFERQ
jgi:hypothetical protein